MSYPIFWAAERAPVRDAEERAILIGLVLKGDRDGMNCFPSYATLARIARVDPKTVGRKCRAMEERGIIRRQTGFMKPAWLKIPEAQRPVVWEVMVPAEWYSAQQLEEVNADRARDGLPPITSESRPPLAEAPPKRQRADKGTKRPRKTDDPGTTSPQPTDYKSPGDPGTSSPQPTDFKSPAQGLEVPSPGTSSPTTFIDTFSGTPSDTTDSSLPSEDGLFVVADQQVPPADAVGEGTQAKKPAKADHSVADALTKAFWDVHGQGRAQPFLAVRGVVRTAIRNGVVRDDLARALDLLAREGRPVSGATVDMALGQVRRASGRASFQPPADLSDYENGF
ncbi:hypothetical protein SUDANB1_05596 [Streptomyces sp. enrichment culture]|uniref:hypothetical protein n=1 Tax=Streptomyces sp. enrichment culture TaxID=1795815 RepID=UPI003F55848C